MSSEEKIQYYGSWSGYSIPYKPSEPITKEEALKRTSYYIGYYEGKQLMKFEKFLNGEKEWTDEYTYWPDGKVIQKRIMTKADGTVVTQQFDKKGKVIKE